MLPVSRNISMYKGDTFELFFRLRTRDVNGDPGAYVDLTGCVGKAQIRATEDSTSVLTEFTVTISDQVAEPGGVTVSLTAQQTTTVVEGKWDVQLVFPDGAVKTYLRGSVSVVKEITRA